MSDSGEPVSVITGVMEEKYEFVWKIENFLRVAKDDLLLDAQKFEIVTGKTSALESKWVVGLKTNRRPNMTKFYHVYCKLVDISSASGINELSSHFTVQLRQANGSTYWNAEYQGRVKVNEGFDVEQRYWWGNATIWDGFLDSSGAATLYIKLSLLNPLVSSGCGGTNVGALKEQFRVNSVRVAQRNLALLANSTEGDLKLICSDGQEFKCHRVILKSNSTVFDSMLQSGLSEAKTGVVKVTDISGKAMEVILKYLYTGELLPQWSSADVVVEFTYAAGKYQMAPVLQFLDNMLGNMNEVGATLAALLDLANKLSLKKAEARLMERIVKVATSAQSSSDMLSLFQTEK